MEVVAVDDVTVAKVAITVADARKGVAATAIKAVEAEAGFADRFCQT